MWKLINNKCWKENRPKSTSHQNRLYKRTNLHRCTAQTCTPSTSSLRASQCGSLSPVVQLLFPLRWCKASLWSVWPPAANPLVPHRGWSEAWLGDHAMSQNLHLKHCGGKKRSIREYGTMSRCTRWQRNDNLNSTYHDFVDFELSFDLLAKIHRRMWSSFSFTLSSLFLKRSLYPSLRLKLGDLSGST